MKYAQAEEKEELIESQNEDFEFIGPGSTISDAPDSVEAGETV